MHVVDWVMSAAVVLVVVGLCWSPTKLMGSARVDEPGELLLELDVSDNKVKAHLAGPLPVVHPSHPCTPRRVRHSFATHNAATAPQQSTCSIVRTTLAVRVVAWA